MICPDCLENENIEIEMDKVRCWHDTYDHQGKHKEVDLGEYWICPECDNDLPVIEEPDED